LRPAPRILSTEPAPTTPTGAKFPHFAEISTGRKRPRGAAGAVATGGVARIGAVDLARIGWLVTVIACMIAVLVLALEGYAGYAGVTFAVAVSAAINLF
jgi:hypothetical protein